MHWSKETQTKRLSDVYEKWEKLGKVWTTSAANVSTFIRSVSMYECLKNITDSRDTDESRPERMSLKTNQFHSLGR